MYGNNAPWATLYEAFVLNQYLTKEMQFLPFLALFNILLISLRYFVIRLTTGLGWYSNAVAQICSKLYFA